MGHVQEILSDQGAASPAERARLRAAEGFPTAARQTAAGLVELHAGNPVLNRLINDRGRFLVSMFVLDLHFRREEDGIGLTPGRIKDLCLEQAICSPTRCSALLALMKLGGYLEAVPSAHDQRRRTLVATDKLIAAQRARWHCHLASAAPLLPDAARGLERIDQLAFMRGVHRLMCAHLRAGFRFVDYLPALRLFGDRHGGVFALCMMLRASEPGALDHELPIEVSVSGLARATSSSRAHILKLLRDAETAGLLVRPSNGSVVLKPPLVSDLYDFFALNYLVLAHFAKLTIAHCDGE